MRSLQIKTKRIGDSPQFVSSFKRHLRAAKAINTSKTLKKKKGIINFFQPRLLTITLRFSALFFLLSA